MKESFVVRVRRTVKYTGEVVIECETPAEARRLAAMEAEEQSFPWEEQGDEVTTGEMTVQAVEPRRRRQ